MSTNLRFLKEAILWRWWAPSKCEGECVVAFTTLARSCSSLELKWAGLFRSTAVKSRDGQQQETITKSRNNIPWYDLSCYFLKQSRSLRHVKILDSHLYQIRYIKYNIKNNLHSMLFSLNFLIGSPFTGVPLQNHRDHQQNVLHSWVFRKAGLVSDIQKGNFNLLLISNSRKYLRITKDIRYEKLLEKMNAHQIHPHWDPHCDLLHLNPSAKWGEKLILSNWLSWTHKKQIFPSFTFFPLSI